MGASQGKSKKMVLETEDARERTTAEIPTKTEYRIIVENYTSRLTERVNELLIEGWELQGGVNGHTQTQHFRSSVSYDEIWAQAMIKK
jgi:hypothetical protein